MLLNLADIRLPRLVRGLLALGVCGVFSFPLCADSRAVAAEKASDIGVRVMVDPRVELMSIIFRLAGNREYNRGCVLQYTNDVEKQFGDFRDHEAVQLARRLRQTRGVSFDACMSMAVHITEPPELHLRTRLDPWPKALDHRWPSSDVPKFLAAVRQFAEKSKFSEFFTAQGPLYEQATSRMQSMLQQHAHLDWFDKFFGGKRKVHFVVALGMLNGPNCYGPRFQAANGQVEMYCILGVWRTDAEGIPEFQPGMVTTVVHEFCHSYANPIVDRFASDAQDGAQRLFASVKDAMSRQAYSNWKTMLYESLVRASTVRYILANDGPEAARQAILREKHRSFLWTDELADLLGEYEAQRDRYPSLDDFAPRLAEFFNTYADQVDAQAKAAAAKQPRVVSTIPADGVQDVDPSLAAIKVVFDRPMQNGSWSLVGIGPHFPTVVGDPSYDAATTAWSVPVKLKPGWSYKFMLNSSVFTGFRSREGVALSPVTVRFRTKEDTSGANQ